MRKTTGIVEQHIHGAFGYDFMNCSAEDILTVAKMLLKSGVSAFFPTVMTDDKEVIKERIAVIKEAQKKNTKDGADIAGIHLEGPFINKEKAGIHEKKYILPLNIDLYKDFEDEIIKIITVAPELDENGDFINYLKSKGVKVSAGHCLGDNLENAVQVTHLYNAMGGFSHRGGSTVVSALADENIYAEIIADSMHVSDEVLKLTFKMKNINKIILISDALPLAHSSKKEHIFAGQKIYNKNGKLVNAEGVFAGSSLLICDIIKNVVDKGILTFDEAIQAASLNQMNYHKIQNKINVFWNEDNTVNKVEII